MPRASGNDICEIFGYAPDDLTEICRHYWNRNLCPFMGTGCTKYNHDQTVTYGVCSLVSSGEEVIICPKRLYADCYQTIRDVSADAFGEIPLFFVNELQALNFRAPYEVVVALGHDSGKEIQVGNKNKMSMDWVLAKVVDGEVIEIAGIEVQSIDITNNYRDAWQAYKNLPIDDERDIPKSQHGMNWANVHKRLIPQIIRKGVVYKESELARKGIYFIVPEVVYKRFEIVVGKINPVKQQGHDTLNVFTYAIDEPVKHGLIRRLKRTGITRISLDEFALNFVGGGGANLGPNLDYAVRKQINTLFSK
ncbi:MAG: NotI family restriction endonuclease [Syntrophomonadaceae bacterium]